MSEKTSCACLRWKGMFIDVERNPAIPKTSDGFFWCSRTMNCLGPDGKLAHQASCRPGRPCFEEV